VFVWHPFEICLLVTWNAFNFDGKSAHLFTCHTWNMREVLVSCREKLKKIIADFHVLGLFMARKHDLSEKNFSVRHAPLPLNAKFVPRLQPIP
jgi:hypothetical protein